MMNDLDIKNKRILLFDFDGTLIETASENAGIDYMDVITFVGK